MLKDLYYIRGIVRNTCRYYFDNAKALELLKIARSWGVPMSELRDIASRATSWTKFRNRIHKAIEYQQQEEDSLEDNGIKASPTSLSSGPRGARSQ